MKKSATTMTPSPEIAAPTGGRDIEKWANSLWIVMLMRWGTKFVNRCLGATHTTNLLLIAAIMVGLAMGGVLTYHVTLLQNIYAKNSDLTKSVHMLAAIEALRLYQAGISPESIQLMMGDDEAARAQSSAPISGGNHP